MDEKRRDPKGRILRTGESYDPVKQRYRYVYKNSQGKRRNIYSYTLTKNDSVPAGKKQDPGMSLREREQAVLQDVMEEIDSTGGNMTVYSLMEKYVKLKSPDVRETTRKGYQTQLNFMKNNEMGKRRINSLNATECEEWLTELHTKQGKSFSTLHTLRGVLRPAFSMAKRNRWVRDNPFDFPMNKKRYGGVQQRDALSRKDMRRFLDFMRTDKHFSKYFEGTYILFNTGLRISEFCGLREDDIDFDKHVIRVRRQLLRLNRNGRMELYTEEPKTKNGIRDVPMLMDVETCFRKVIENRQKIKEYAVWNEDRTESLTGFLWIDKNGCYETAQHWINHLRWSVAKFNRIYRDPLPVISPHICRHTFCSNMASLGMSPKTLQTIMGHSSIEVTLNVYTHMEPDIVQLQFFSNPQYNLYPLSRTPNMVSFEEDSIDDEPDPDLSQDVGDED